MFDLRGFRENVLKMTQAEFASLIGERQDYISRLEQSSSQIPLEVLIKIATKTGQSIDQLINFSLPKSKPIAVDDTWKASDFTKRTIVDYIDDRGTEYRNKWGSTYDKHINELREKVQRVISKPKVAIIGHSDVGKSRLINTILGSDKMPAAWTPTTSITVYIKHIMDRPKFIEEEAWIFRIPREGAAAWDEKRLYEESYCREWKIAGGSADILKDYGTRQGQNYGKNEAGAAVIFVDSKILKNCDIIDLPGFGTGDRVEDDMMALKAKEFADVLVYMSIANGFMREGDIEYLKEAINALNVIENKRLNTIKPLSNLFILASQAHTVDHGNPKSLSDILDNGCSRLLKTMPNAFWDNKKQISGYEYDYSVARSRFFTYTTDIEGLRESFEKEFKNIVEMLPVIINEKAKEFVKQYIDEAGIDLDNAIEQYNDIIVEKDKYETLLNEIKMNEPMRANENHNRRIKLIDKIEDMKNHSVGEFSTAYGSLLSVDSIVSIIDKKGFKKKKEDIQLLVSYINSTLQSDMQNILKGKSDDLKVRIDEYISEFQGSIKMSVTQGLQNDIKISFNATKAFASGLAGLAVYGGLAIWAASLGNLGAYILVAKGVSLLSALGISIAGGTAGAAAAVAAIGGPVVLGIALAVIAAVSLFALISGGWQKSLAKKIVKEYDSKNCFVKYKENIEQFWSDTKVAFNKSADALDDEWANHMDNLEKMVSSYDINDIERRIKAAEEFKSFLANIPLIAVL